MRISAQVLAGFSSAGGMFLPGCGRPLLAMGRRRVHLCPLGQSVELANAVLGDGFSGHPGNLVARPAFPRSPPLDPVGCTGVVFGDGPFAANLFPSSSAVAGRPYTARFRAILHAGGLPCPLGGKCGPTGTAACCGSGGVEPSAERGGYGLAAGVAGAGPGDPARDVWHDAAESLGHVVPMPFRAGDHCVLYLSEFDFTNQDEFPFAWFRPYASWRTLPGVLQSMSRRTKTWHWRRVTDYMLAATVQSWQVRDFLQQVAVHFWAPASQATRSGNDDVKTVLVTSARAELKHAPAEQRAFLRFAKRLAAHDVDMVIFEGDVNPAIYSPSRMAAKSQVRDFLVELTADSGQRYVSREEQGLAFTAEDWSDMSHLNSVGREKLTRRMAEVLSENTSMKREPTQ